MEGGREERTKGEAMEGGMEERMEDERAEGEDMEAGTEGEIERLEKEFCGAGMEGGREAGTEKGTEEGTEEGRGMDEVRDFVNDPILDFLREFIFPQFPFKVRWVLELIYQFFSPMINHILSNREKIFPLDVWRNRVRKAGTEGGTEEGREGGMEGGTEEGTKEGTVGGTEGGTEEGTEGGTEEGIEGGTEYEKDFQCEIDKLETEMDIILFIKDMMYLPALESFLSPYISNVDDLDDLRQPINKLETFLRTTTFTIQREENKQNVFDLLVSVAYSLEDIIGKIVARSSVNQFTSSETNDLFAQLRSTIAILVVVVATCEVWKGEREMRAQLTSKVIDAIINPLIDVNILTKLLLDTEDSSNCITPDLSNEELLLIKAFPALGELKESSKMHDFLLEVTIQVDKPMRMICDLFKQDSPAVLLIGGLLSFKRPHLDAWERVHDDLDKVIKPGSITNNDLMGCIFTYCLGDLPVFLRTCFLYLACYPIGSEIPATCLTKIWISEEFITPEEGETLEETANKYLEEFVQRSLLWVSMRSYSGTIKYCRVPRPIHKFVIQKSFDEKFLVANPNEQATKPLYRVAIHHDFNNQYPDVKIKPVRSFLAFDFDTDVLGSSTYLRVLHLRNYPIPETTLLKLRHLHHMSLRGSNIGTLPKDIGKMKHLQTLDVRNTNIQTLPESLWNILALRHVYTNPRLQIQGPPPEANLSNLQTLKTIMVPESWLKNFPHSMINLRKLALTNMDNPACKPNPYWISISNLLSHLVNPLSLAIKGDVVPAEFVDTRAFPNLETVKSIKLEGRWNYFKLTIDNNKFPPNLTKLTLTKSGLKEDPMPSLERLQALKYLTLKDGAYMGKKMVCSANGFPQLDFLELSELNNLETWEADPMAIPQLTKLRVVKCCKLENIPNLEHVTDKDIVN